MNPDSKPVWRALVNAVLYLSLCVILIPAVVDAMDRPLGKTLYGVMVAGCVVLALRLRYLSERWESTVRPAAGSPFVAASEPKAGPGL